MSIKKVNIEIYFNPKYRNDTNTNDREVQNPLVEPLPLTIHPYVKRYFKEISRLPIHEICITFKKTYHDMRATALHNKVREYIEKYTKKYEYFKPSYIFCPEYNASGILHYHGIIYFNNSNDYWTADLKRLLNNKFGRTKGKEVYSFKKYWQYMTKDTNKGKFTVRYFHNVVNSEEEITEVTDGRKDERNEGLLIDEPLLVDHLIDVESDDEAYDISNYEEDNCPQLSKNKIYSNSIYAKEIPEKKLCYEKTS